MSVPSYLPAGPESSVALRVRWTLSGVEQIPQKSWGLLSVSLSSQRCNDDSITESVTAAISSWSWAAGSREDTGGPVL